MAIQVLPQARSADQGSRREGAGSDFAFYCHVSTSRDSLMFGQAKVTQISREDWLKYYKRSGDDQPVIRVSVGDIEALALPDSRTSAVYVPCKPTVVPEDEAKRPFAVISEMNVNGAAKLKGVPLRQALTDVAYKMAAHTYELAECKAPRSFPKELPRYGAGV
ncbi:hypothetical protein GT031_18275 [Streptomyces sp. SID2888]|nr:hypothetical protein [Streptomyces sp. SID2888]